MAADNHVPMPSIADHHHEPKHAILHYSGCLEFCQRETYFSSLSHSEREAIETELRRISYLRITLEQDDDDAIWVKNITESMSNWRKNDLYTSQHGITAVRAWRTTRPDGPLPNGRSQRPALSAYKGDSEKYIPEYDINAHFIRYKNSEPYGMDTVDTSTLGGDARFRGEFPSQTINVTDLLQQEKQE